MHTYRLSALVAAGLLAGGLATTSANAADLGGNCCADLEERVAELEATTARKGNRKVSLTVSGWVGEQVMWWDDGFESNTYVGGLGTTIGTNVKFTGQATISPGWSAGYVIHIEADGSETLVGTSQDVDEGPGLYSLLNGSPTTNYVQTLQSFWFVKSDHLGKVGIGLQSQASDNTAILVDGSGSLIAANYVAFDYGGFFLRPEGSGKAVAGSGNWFGLLGCTDCNGLPENSIRYDSPTYAGFSASASWGADDFWDVALRFASETHGFKLAAAAAYSESTDGGPPVSGRLNVQGDVSGVIEDTQFFQIGAYVQHIACGLFLYGAYGQFDGDLVDTLDGRFQSHDFWYVKTGLRTKWSPHGATIPYIEYETSNDGAAGVITSSADIASSSFDLWGIGVVQEIDAAAMSVWLKYRHIDGDVTTEGGVKTDFDDFDYVSFGGLINF
jgi:hypothetical protein